MHQGAAGTIRPWQPEPGRTWTLRPAAEPLVILAKNRDGEPAAATAVTSWIDSVRVGGYALAFLAWSIPVTDGEGVWHARNLPAAPLQVLIGAQSAIDSGSYDAMAATIPHP